MVAGRWRDEVSHAVKIEIPDGLDDGDVIKALESTARALKKDQRTESRDHFRNQNPASKKLSDFVDESYNIMVNSLVKQIAKVLKEG